MSLLREEPPQALTRAPSSYYPLHDFHLAKAEGYQQQYGDIYFLRLAKLKPEVEKIAREAWDGYNVGLAFVILKRTKGPLRLWFQRNKELTVRGSR